MNKILVVEDDPVSALLMKEIVSKRDYNVVVTRDGTEALATLEKYSFDAIITDWLMPRMDGMELIRRAQSIANPMPIVIVITSLSCAAARTHALLAGADYYLTKPCEPKEVRDILDHHLRKSCRSHSCSPSRF